MFNPNLLTTIAGESLMWRQDQIGEINGHEVELSMSEEDMENGELSAQARAEIRLYKKNILAEVARRGYTIVR